MQYARENWDEVRAKMNAHPVGMPFETTTRLGAEDTPSNARRSTEELWQKGSFNLLFGSYADLLTNKETNRTLADFIRAKIRECVKDPEIAEKLMPDYYLGTKRQVLDNGYYETFNRENVTLVDLREDPIQTVTSTGVRTETGRPSARYDRDGQRAFDAISGTLLRLNPKGRGGVGLKEKWSSRFDNYLGYSDCRLPQIVFMIHGPGSPSVLYNMPLGAERETGVDRQLRAIIYRERGVWVPSRRRRMPRKTGTKRSTNSPTRRSTPSLTPGTQAPTSQASPVSSRVHLGVVRCTFSASLRLPPRATRGFVFEEENNGDVSAASLSALRTSARALF